ncbi:MAG: hypothetical protein H6765_04410 [Candidatus Peribacteria bacterium]|nr:MAG: hypothetical protein H6765_04410 [Candidatus Peribacteria bacterium]
MGDDFKNAALLNGNPGVPPLEKIATLAKELKDLDREFSIDEPELTSLREIILDEQAGTEKVSEFIE